MEHQVLATCLFVIDIFRRIVDSSPDLLSLLNASVLESNQHGHNQGIQSNSYNSSLFQGRKYFLSGYFVLGDLYVSSGLHL